MNTLSESQSGPTVAPKLTWNEWQRVWVTLEYRLCKTPADDPCFAEIERLCKKIAPVLVQGGGA